LRPEGKGILLHEVQGQVHVLNNALLLVLELLLEVFLVPLKIFYEVGVQRIEADLEEGQVGEGDHFKSGI